MSTLSLEDYFRRQLDTIIPAASNLFEKICGEHEELVEKSPDRVEAKKNWGIEQKLIRSILHTILHDMERSLRASMDLQAKS